MNKKTILISALIAVTLTAAGLYYLHFKSSPQYSLLQLGHAVMDHDYPGFEKYMDTDSTISSVIDQMFEKDDRGTSAANFLNGVGLMDMIKPQLGMMFKPLVQQWIEKGKGKGIDPFTGQGSLTLPDVWSNDIPYRFSGIEFIKREGDVARIGLGIQPTYRDTVLIITLKMIDKGDHWQVTGLPGFSEFRKGLTNLEQKRVDGANKSIREEMQRTLKLAYLEHGTAKYENGLPKNLLFGIKNSGTKAIASYEAVVSVSDAQHLPKEIIHINTTPQNFSPSKVDSLLWTSDATNLAPSWLYETQANSVSSTLSVISIRFSDSTSLRLKNMWQWE